jgi:hypothetical protein
MRAEMTLDEAMTMADRYRRTTEGPYAEAFGVLCDHIIVTTRRLEEATKRLQEATDRVQALSLDLGLKDGSSKPSVNTTWTKEDGSNVRDIASGFKKLGPGTSVSVGVTGVGGKGGTF